MATRPRHPTRIAGRALRRRTVDHDLGSALLELLGERGCVEPLAVLELPERERATLIGQLYWRQRGQVLAELLLDVESDPDDLTRLRLIDALRQVLA